VQPGHDPLLRQEDPLQRQRVALQLGDPAALAGALTGACGGYEAIPEGWTASARTLAGCCLPELAGKDLIELTKGIA
jgi:hypothetical protein